MISSTNEVHSGSQVKTLILDKADYLVLKVIEQVRFFSIYSPNINIDEHHGYLSCECIAT